MDSREQRAGFTRMDQGQQADWNIIISQFRPFAAKLPDRIMSTLRELAGDFGGYAVDRYTHSLQTATRAHQDGRDEEYVVCALLHDIGDIHGTFNHAEIGAAILKPFVSEQNHWMLDKHGIFQGYYFFHYIGLDRDTREAFRGHPHFEHTAEFCEKYDQVAFDPAFVSMPLEAFEPMLRRVMAVPRNSIYMTE